MNISNWKQVVSSHGYIKTKRGLIEYLKEQNKLPFVSCFYSVTIDHYKAKTISDLLQYA